MSAISVTRTFIVDAFERAVKTFVQAFVATVATANLASAVGGNHSVDWSVVEKIGGSATLAGISAVLSVLTSLVSGWKTDTASASTRVADSVPSSGVHTVTVAPLPVVPPDPALTTAP